MQKRKEEKKKHREKKIKTKIKRVNRAEAGYDRPQCRVLAGKLADKLRIQEVHPDDPKVELFEVLNQLAHQRHVCIQLNLARAIKQEVITVVAAQRFVQDLELSAGQNDKCIIRTRKKNPPLLQCHLANIPIHRHVDSGGEIPCSRLVRRWGQSPASERQKQKLKVHNLTKHMSWTDT